MLIGAAAVIIVPISVVVLMWSFQRSLIYHPDTSEVPSASEVIPYGQDLTLKTFDGLELGAWFAPPAPEVHNRELAVLIAPGNGGNRLARSGLVHALQQQGFAVLAMDYRGYGTNPGSPSEEGLIRDGLAAVEALETQGYPPERTIYFGESLGGGVVAALLAQRAPAGVVFRSPFTELAGVGQHHYPWLPVDTILRDEFPVRVHVAESPVPVTVIRAHQDSVVPTELSADVAAAAQHLVEERVIEGVDHNDPVMFGPEIAEAVARLAESLAP